MVLIILAVVWALYLLSWLRGHAASRRRSTNSIASFSQHLSVLERTRPAAEVAEPTVVAAPRRTAAASTVTALAAARDRRVEQTPPAVTGPTSPVRSVAGPAAGTATRPPRNRSEAQRRRREVLFFLGGLNLLSLGAAMAFGGIGIVLLAVSATLAGGYLYLLSQATMRADQRRADVHYLHEVDGWADEDEDPDAWYDEEHDHFDEPYLAHSGA